MNDSLIVENIDPIPDEFLPEPFVDKYGRVVPFMDEEPNVVGKSVFIVPPLSNEF